MKRFSRIRMLLMTVLVLLLAYSAALASQENGPLYSTFVENDGGDTILWDSPNPESAQALNVYFDGTQVALLDEAEAGYVHVQIGRMEGYMEADALANLRIPLNDDGTMRPIGYLVTVARDVSAEATNNYEAPSEKSGVVVWANGIEDGCTELLLGDLGDWYQTRGPLGEANLGFVQAVNRDKYLLKDLIVKDVHITSQDGVFSIGTQIPSGLYTFVPYDEDVGSLTIFPLDGQEAYTLSTRGSYTLYLRAGQKICVESNGVLSAMSLVNKEKTSLSSDGCFFIGGQLKGNENYTLTSRDGMSNGYYRIHNLNGAASDYVAVPPSESVDRFLNSGEFLEIENCVVTLTPSYG